ncbi:MAG: ABC transporter ATP-binding protein [Magnetococcales bacterium]|nr:ABC transporter ATP-binding protein [Magnetococcales bacterium]
MDPILTIEQAIPTPPFSAPDPPPLTLTLAPGQSKALLGPEGCGKSHLLMMLAGLHPPATGSITLDGVQLEAYSDRGRAQLIGLLFQNPEHPFLTLTVQEEITLTPAGLGLSGQPLKQRVQCAMTECNIPQSWAERELSSLSWSEKCRVAMAAVWAAEPKVILADEPGAFRSTDGELQMAEQLQHYLNNHNAAALIVTSRARRARRFAQETILWPGFQATPTTPTPPTPKGHA